MEHKKTYFAKEIEIPDGLLLIEGPVPPEKLAQFEFPSGPYRIQAGFSAANCACGNCWFT